MKLLFFLLLLGSCSHFSQESGTNEALKKYKLIGKWVDTIVSEGPKGYLRILCEGQIEYHHPTGPYGNPRSLEGARISAVDARMITTIPFKLTYKIDQMPFMENGKLVMVFEGDKYALQDEIRCE